jgi:copper chaperone CopZ
MAALVRHETITARPALGWTGANDAALAKLYSSAIGPSPRIIPHAGEAARSFIRVGRTAKPEGVERGSQACTYVVHQPGRLQLLNAEFRDKPSLLEAARGELGALPGVSSVSANSLTGSVLVEYDPVVFSPAALSEALRKRGFPCIEIEALTPATAPRKTLTAPFAKIAVRALFGALAERLLVALVAAVI